jgi:hypothetical protein
MSESDIDDAIADAYEIDGFDVDYDAPAEEKEEEEPPMRIVAWASGILFGVMDKILRYVCGATPETRVLDSYLGNVYFMDFVLTCKDWLRVATRSCSGFSWFIPLGRSCDHDPYTCCILCQHLLREYANDMETEYVYGSKFDGYNLIDRTANKVYEPHEHSSIPSGSVLVLERRFKPTSLICVPCAAGVWFDTKLGNLCAIVAGDLHRIVKKWTFGRTKAQKLKKQRE